MVELDYVFEVNELRRECQRADILSDTDLKYELSMPMRLRMGETEIFELTEEEYQSQAFRDRLPSAAWDFIPVLKIAAFVDTYFSRLRKEGYCDIIFLDPDLRLTLHGDIVTVGYFYAGAPQGRAPYEDLYDVFATFSERVRHEFLSICPMLIDHVELGEWFRRGGNDPASGN